MIDTFDTAVLNTVVADLHRPSSFLLDLCFPEVQTEASEEIHFDIDKSRPRITPYVSPLVAGKVIQSNGFSTDSFKPAYVKDLRVFNSQRPLKRVIGESIGGNLSPQERRDLLLRRDLEDQQRMFTRRFTVMASEILRTGAVVISGEEYQTKHVNFGRSAVLTKQLVGTARWIDPNYDGNVMDDIEDWVQDVQTESGAVVKDIIWGPDVWKLVRKRPEVKEAANRDYGSTNEFQNGPSILGTGQESARLVMVTEQLRFWVYQEPYVDEQGISRKMMPANTVMGVATGDTGIQGVRAFGAIQDEEAGFQALESFTKSWVEKNPSVRYLLAQSAPLLVPYRPNASFCTTVG